MWGGCLCHNREGGREDGGESGVSAVVSRIRWLEKDTIKVWS